MTLESGRRLGAFEILEPIGAVGMGEVYRAKDTRLDRTVALKVLPSELSADPALRERLEREAKAISSLAHPHICTLHDVGQDDGIDYLVMEYLEGDHPGRAAAEGAATPGAGPQVRHRDRRGPQRSPSARRRPPGPEARQRHADEVGGQTPGLRPGEVA